MRLFISLCILSISIYAYQIKHGSDVIVDIDSDDNVSIGKVNSDVIPIYVKNDGKVYIGCSKSDMNGNLALNICGTKVSIKNYSSTESEEEGTDFTVTVKLSKAVSGDTTVDWEIKHKGVAPLTNADDFDSDNDHGSVVIGAGNTEASFAFHGNDDDNWGDDENFVVALTNVDNGVTIDSAKDEKSNILTNNDAKPTWSIADRDADDEDAGDVDFTVSISKATEKDITIDASTYFDSDDSDPCDNNDLDPDDDKTTTLTLSSGADSVAFTVSINDDGDDEADEEQYHVKIKNASDNITIDDDNAKGAINDNDSSGWM